MPVHRYLVGNNSLNYVTARQPFVLNDLFSVAQRDMETDQAEDLLSLPIMLDLRKIDLLDYPTEQFKLLLAQRQSLNVSAPVPPCAYIARDDGSFGMLRIFTNFAEARGFRRESLTIVTTDIEEGLQWLLPMLQNTDLSAQGLLDEIEKAAQKLDAEIPSAEKN